MTAIVPFRQEIVFIDSSVPNYSQLLPNNSANAEIVVLDPERDGLAQIAEALAGRGGLDAVHIISHGSPGVLLLGNARLSLAALDGYRDALASIGRALKSGGDLLLYGCKVAAGSEGRAFLQALAEATGADVAASDNLTGFGGDWELEVATGAVASGSPFDPATLAGYAGTLADNTAPSFAVGDGMALKSLSIDNDRLYGVTVQGDGKILAVGEMEMYDASHPSTEFQGVALLRYHSDGTLDTGFDGDGLAGGLSPGINNLTLNGAGKGLDVTIQNDGRILVIGDDGDLLLYRYTSDGRFDNSFGGGDGKVSTDFLGADSGRSVAVQDDGKILVVGWKDFFGGQGIVLARYTSDGLLDSGFGQSGAIFTSVGSGSSLGYDLALQSDGKILVAGTTRNGSHSDIALVRYDANGVLDTTFDAGGNLDGIVITPISINDNDEGHSLVLQDDGKILVTGYADQSGQGFGGPINFALVRYNSDGTLDTDFGKGGIDGDGIVTTDFGEGSDIGHSVALQSDGKILVAGTVSQSGFSRFGLARYNPDGTLDTDFGPNHDGKVTNLSFAGEGLSLTVQSDGKILMVGVKHPDHTDIALVRYHPDGTLDTSFDPANTLNGAPAYTEHGAPVILDTDVNILDAELAALNGRQGNYAGAGLTLARHGGANPEDVFSLAPSLLFTVVTVAGVDELRTVDGTFATVEQSGGVLTIRFTDSGTPATQALVDDVLRHVQYANASSTPPASVQIDWTFDDGNTGAQGSGSALSTTGSTTVSIAGVNTAPVLAEARLAVDEGGAAVLSPFNFTLTDPDGDTQFTYTVSGVTGGAFQTRADDFVWTDATSFTTAQIEAGLARFLHDGGEAAPTFSIKANDGGADSDPIAGTVDFTSIGDAPVLDSDRSPVLHAVDEDAGAPVNGSTLGSTPVAALIDSVDPLKNYFDAEGDPAGIVITGVNGGTLWYSTDGGGAWTSHSEPPSDGSALLLHADGATRLYFQPAAGFNGNLLDAITFKAWDRGGGYNNGATGVDTTSLSLKLSGAADVGGYAQNAIVVGNLAYLADDVGGLKIIDVSDPAQPTVVSRYDTVGWALAVAVSGNYAFVAAGDAGLEIIDVSDPAHPVLVGAHDTGGYAEGVAVDGHYAYVGDSANGLLIFDVADPSHPVPIDSHDTAGYAGDVAINGSKVYVADDDAGFVIVDVTDPAHPVLAGSFSAGGDVESIALKDSLAYVADDELGLLIFNVADPAHPIQLSQFIADVDGDGTDDTAAEGVVVSGDHAYVAYDTAGLAVVNIANPSLPVFKGNYNTAGHALSVFVAGDYAYVADDNDGFNIIDVSNPADPTGTGEYDPGYADSVVVKGHYAYVADGSDGLTVIDIADPTRPATVGQYDTGGYGDGVAVQGDYVYLADGNDGLLIFDIATPANPVLAASFDTAGYAENVAVQGRYAYVADGGKGLLIFDIDDPAHPVLRGSYNTAGYAEGVAVSGRYASVADGGNGLLIFDIADPAHPVLKGSHATDYAEGVAMDGRYVYIPDGNAGLLAFDVIDPANPVLLDSYNTSGYASNLSVCGRQVFLADGWEGLKVFDVSNPANLARVGHYNTGGFTNNAAISGDFVYLADEGGGLVAVRLAEAFSSTGDTASVTVRPANDAPVAVDDAITVAEDSPFTSIVDLDANDTDVDGDSLSVVAGTLATARGGVLALNADGSYVYTPPGDFNGVDTVDYSVTDGALSDTGTLSITVTPVNDAPAATITTDSYGATEGIVLSLKGTGLALADPDAGDTSVTATLAVGEGALTVDAGVSGVTVGGSGTGTVTLTGTVAQINALLDSDDTSAVNYLNASATPSVSTLLTLSVDDNGNSGAGGAKTGVDTTTITIAVGNKAPTTADHTITLAEDSAHAFVVDDDFPFADPDAGDTRHTVRIDTLPAPAFGSLTLNGSMVTAGQEVQAEDIAAGMLVFTPTTNANGTASFNFSVSDGQAFSAPATLTLNVTPVNDAPTAKNNGYAALEDTLLAGKNFITDADASAGTDNDVDRDSFKLTHINGTAVTLDSPIALAHGTLIITNENGAFSYMPVLNDTAGDSFFYTVSDGNGGSSTARVTISVTADNDAPTVVQPIGNRTATEDSFFGFQIVEGTFVDPDGDALSYGATRADGTPLPTWLRFVVDPDSKIPYFSGTPTNDDVGSFAVTVTASDGTASVSDTFTLVVENTNDVPTVAHPLNNRPLQNRTATEDSRFTLAVADAFADVDVSDNLRYFSSSRPAWLVFDEKSATFTGTPANGDVGSFDIQVTAFDGTASVSDILTLVVANTNDTPTGDVSILGTPAQGQIVTTNFPDGVTDADGLLLVSPSFQWRADGKAIEGATFSHLTLTQDQVGKAITVTVSYTDNRGTPESLTSEFPTSPVANVNDAPAGKPRILGTPAQGETLTANMSMVTDADGLGNPDEFRYLWDVGGSIINGIGGAGSTLTLTQDQVGKTITVTVSYTDKGGTLESPTSDPVTVANVNDAPVAVADSVTTNEDEDEDVTVTAALLFGADGSGPVNDSDVDSSFVSIAIRSLPILGTLKLNGVPVELNQVIPLADINAGKLSFVPNSDAINFTYNSSFQYAVSDGVLSSDAATVTIRVTPVDDAPVAVDDIITTSEDTEVTVTAALLFGSDGRGVANDSDIDSNFAAITLAALPSKGSLRLDGTAVALNQVISVADIDAGKLSFVPIRDENGSAYASFKYIVSDGARSSNEATVTIDVSPLNDVPVAVDDTASATEDGLLFASTFGVGVLFNDLDPDGDRVTMASASIGKFTTSEGGSINLAADGSYSYKAPADFAGNDTFDYTVTDGKATDTGRLTIKMTPVNDAPLAVDDVVTANEDAVVAVTAALLFGADGSGAANDSDIDSNIAAIAITALPSKGSLRLDGTAVALNQVISVADIDAGKLSFVPILNENGSAYANFKYIVSDGARSSNEATVTIHLTPVNDRPFIVSRDFGHQTATEDRFFSMPLIEIFNFKDADAGDSLTYSVAQPLPAWLRFEGRTFKGTPSNEDVGSRSITVTATDSAGAKVSGTFSLDVVNSNDAPFVDRPIVDQTVAEDSRFGLSVADAFKDVDAGDRLTYVKVGTTDGHPLPNWLRFNNGQFSGTPGNDDVGSLGVIVVATDRAGATVSFAFRITVNNTNDAPIVKQGISQKIVSEDHTFGLSVDKIFEDTDAGDILTYSVTRGNGSALPAWLRFGGSSLGGTPGNDDVGSLSIRVTATDRAVTQVSNAFILTVLNVNDAPKLKQAIADQTATEDSPFSLSIAKTFEDVDAGASLTYSAKQKDGSNLPAWLALDGDEFTGIPDHNDAGRLEITVTAADEFGAKASDTFTLTVEAINAAPTIRLASVNPATVGVDTLSYTGQLVFGDANPDDSPAIVVDPVGTPLGSVSAKITDIIRDAKGMGGLVGWTYDVSQTALEGMAPVSQRTDNFALTLSDGHGGKFSQNLNILLRNGTSSSEEISGTPGEDILLGGTGRDTLNGLAGHDALNGGVGDDTLDGGAGADLLQGGEGRDTAAYLSAPAAVRVSLAQATRQDTRGAGDDTLSGIENLVGSTFDDELTGDSFGNLLRGGEGNDILKAGGSGSDTLEGGNGDDILIGHHAEDRFENGRVTASYASAGAAVTVNLALSDKRQNTGGAGTDRLVDVIENLTGSAFADALTGDTRGNVLNGGAGSDVLVGGGGRDTLLGDDDNDMLEGGDGDDILNGGNGINTASYASATRPVTVRLALDRQDTRGAGIDTLVNIENLTGSAFSDFLIGNSGDNLLSGGDGDDILDGGGDDTASYGSATAAVSVSLALTGSQDTGSVGFDTLIEIEHLIGSAFDDRLTGDAGDNILDGGDGDDTLEGGGGDDQLQGGRLGHDTASYLSAPEAVKVSLALETRQDTQGAGDDTLTRIENLTGSAFDDKLTGNVGNNVLNGGDGDDTLDAGKNGIDILEGGSGDDVLLGHADGLFHSGHVTASYVTATAGVTVSLAKIRQDTGGAGTDTLDGIDGLTGSAFADVLTGDSLGNVLNGGDGDDILSGGDGGRDILSGGRGIDTFVFATRRGIPDRVLDFQSGTDRLRFQDGVPGLNIGDGNHRIDHAFRGSVPAFQHLADSNQAELVIFTGSLDGALTAGKVAETIHSASTAYDTGDVRLFAVNNGKDTALFLFESDGADALISAAELTLIGVLEGAAQTRLADYAFA